MVLNDVKKVFKKFVVNGDGKISITELGSILAAVIGSMTPESELKSVMKEFDGVEVMSKELHEAFDLYDADKNGHISVNEFFSIIKRLGEKVSLKNGKKMIQHVAVNDDDERIWKF
ncbi:calcium-binding protein CML24-like protein [Tanacetum coccineum]